MKKAYKSYKRFRKAYPEIHAFVAVVIGFLCMCFGWLFVIGGCISNPVAVILLVAGFGLVGIGTDDPKEERW